MDLPDLPDLPLDGVRVLDLTRALAGPMCTALLGDLGAEVTKVEGLPRGDSARRSPPFDQGRSLYFAAANRNKRSVAIDLRSPDGGRILRRLLDDCDVLVENFRPGTLEKMGLDPEELRAARPELIIASVSGFGHVGPEAQTPGVDQIAQGMSGLMSVTGAGDQTPMRVGVPIVDCLAGIFAALGVASAVAARERTGRGRHVRTSLLESALAVMVFQAQRYVTTGEVPGPEGNAHPVIAPYGAFATRDQPINIAGSAGRHWRILCEALGAPYLLDDPRFAGPQDRLDHRTELNVEVERLLAGRGAAEWIPLLREAGIPCGPIHDMAGVFADPQVAALGMVQNLVGADGLDLPLLRGPLWTGEDPALVRLPPPAFGGHTREILGAAGLSGTEIDDLVARGVVVDGEPGRGAEDGENTDRGGAR